MIDFELKSCYNFGDLVRIISLLRQPGGCPWDAEQTHESIKKNLIEETYEVIEAINKKDTGLLLEELGDLLMQVVMHAQFEAEKSSFSIEDVCDGICKKLIIRHPHVFGELKADNTAQALGNWEKIKMQTKGYKTVSESINSVPKELPALMRATKIQKKAADIGFDWDSVEGAYSKISEEVEELKEASLTGDKQRTADELGDVLFSVVNVSRFLGVDAEESLTAANDKFSSRFAVVERLAQERGIDMKKASIQELDLLWDEAKVINNAI